MMLARYRVVRELGRGATGAVYAAQDRETGAVVALKRLDPALVTKADPELGKRFARHARSARALEHANIARTYDAGEAAGTAYVAMEMLEGESLRKILEHGPMPAARAVRIAHDIACGLAHAHLGGVVHGGLRPSNVFVLPSGAVKIADFGIAQLGHSTPGYLSPEQMRGEAIDHRSDLFSLGAMLYEMLTQRPVENILQTDPAPPSELNPRLPRALDAVVLGMLAREPAARSPGAPIVVRDLKRLQDELRLVDPPTASPPLAEPEPQMKNGEAFDHEAAIALMERESRAARISRPRPAWVPAFAMALAIVGIGFAGFTYYSPTTRPVATAPVVEAPSRSTTPAVATTSSAPPASIAPVAATPPPAASAPQAAAEPDGSKTLAAEVKPPRQEPKRVVRRSEQPARAEKPIAKAPEIKPRPTARLVLAVSPRGEVYIDGKHHGTTPPLKSFELEPGMRRIEVRSGSKKPFLTYMTLEAGEERRVRHDFNAKPIRPPG